MDGEEYDHGDGSESEKFPDYFQTLSKNIHRGLPLPTPGKCSLVKGDFLYCHYGCDGLDDRGWGCGYRTVQTMSSWLDLHGFPLKRTSSAPTIPLMQRALVTMQDKPASFANSREWIGTFEASLVLDFFYDVPCRLVHVPGGGAELERAAAQELHRHFHTHGSPVMMGGDRDNSSKGIVGVCTGEEGSYLLVVDPHYYGRQLGGAELQRRGRVAWKKVSSLDQSSFYNLCLPQTAKYEM